MSIFYTRPLLPPVDLVTEAIQRIWDSAYITNRGEVHRELEDRIRQYLDVPAVALFSSATTALIALLSSLPKGEIITTPFTFAATPHSIVFGGHDIVFADVTPDNFNLDPAAVTGLITDKTRAILPVHVFGNPCDVDGFAAISTQYGIPVYYDAAHTFGTKYRGRSLSSYGTASVLSFHATKLYHTVEGGAIVSTPEISHLMYQLGNFGIAGEGIDHIGLNGKMSEVHAAVGLLVLNMLQTEIDRRSSVASIYHDRLTAIRGIRSLVCTDHELEYAYPYYPVVFETEHARDTTWRDLNNRGIVVRKYFYPACTDYLPYQKYHPLPIATDAARRTMILPMYGELDPVDVHRICDYISDVL